VQIQADRRSAIVAVPIVLLLAVAFLHYSGFDMQIGAVGNIFRSQSEDPLHVNGQMNLKELIFSSKADSVFIDFKANDASIKVNGKELRVLGEDTTLKAENFKGSVNITGDLITIKGDSDQLTIGEITLGDTKFSANLKFDITSFTKLGLGTINEDTRGFIEVGSSQTNFDGNIAISSFSGNLDYSGGVAAFFGNATTVQIKSGFNIFYSAS